MEKLEKISRRFISFKADSLHCGSRCLDKTVLILFDNVCEGTWISMKLDWIWIMICFPIKHSRLAQNTMKLKKSYPKKTDEWSGYWKNKKKFFRSTVLVLFDAAVDQNRISDKTRIYTYNNYVIALMRLLAILASTDWDEEILVRYVIIYECLRRKLMNMVIHIYPKMWLPYLGQLLLQNFVCYYDHIVSKNCSYSYLNTIGIERIIKQSKKEIKYHQNSSNMYIFANRVDVYRKKNIILPGYYSNRDSDSIPCYDIFFEDDINKKIENMPNLDKKIWNAINNHDFENGYTDEMLNWLKNDSLILDDETMIENI